MTSTIIIVIIAGAVKCSIELLVLLLLLHVSSSAFAVERNTAHFSSLHDFPVRCRGLAVHAVVVAPFTKKPAFAGTIIA
jgi:hypothetical protein